MMLCRYAIAVFSCIFAVHAVATELEINYSKAKSNVKAQNETETYRPSYDLGEIELRYGGGDKGKVKSHLRFAQIEYEKTAFSDEDSKLYEIGIDITREFVATETIYPFLMVGIGVGRMKVGGELDESIDAASFSFGAGVSYDLSQKFYIRGGLSYVYRVWDDVQYSSGETQSTNEETIKPFLGVGYRF